MLKIRLSRQGSKKRPFYHIVVADSRFPRDGRFIEKLGTYNPMLQKDNPQRVTLKEERIKYWLGVGAQTTDRVNGFLAKAGLEEKNKITEKTKKNQPRPKTVARMEEKAQKLKEAQEAELQAKQQAEEEAKAANEAAASAEATESENTEESAQ